MPDPHASKWASKMSPSELKMSSLVWFCVAKWCQLIFIFWASRFGERSFKALPILAKWSSEFISHLQWVLRTYDQSFGLGLPFCKSHDLTCSIRVSQHPSHDVTCFPFFLDAFVCVQCILEHTLLLHPPTPPPNPTPPHPTISTINPMT